MIFSYIFTEITISIIYKSDTIKDFSNIEKLMVKTVITQDVSKS